MSSNIIKATFLIASLLFIVSCSDDEEPIITPDPDMPVAEELVIYTGDKITFTKEDGTDETQEANQDRITSNVWITRGTEGGEIFNINSESASTQGSSPAGTEWAVGTSDNIRNLRFDTFRNAVGSPQDVVGIDLVLHLLEDDEYVDVTFLSWSRGRNDAGGFSYIRATK